VTPTASDTCTLRDPARPETVKCWERSSIFRTDGLCGFHGKVKDGLCGSSPLGTSPGLRGGMTANAARKQRRARWTQYLDGAVHEVPGDPDMFRRNANQAARTRQLSVQVWTEAGKTYIQSHPREAVAS
jgi:hypothetical protein